MEVPLGVEGSPLLISTACWPCISNLTPVKPKYPKSAENAANFPACTQCSRPVFLIESQFLAHHVGLISKHAGQECRRGGRFQQSPLAGPCVWFGRCVQCKGSKAVLINTGLSSTPKGTSTRGTSTLPICIPSSSPLPVDRQPSTVSTQTVTGLPWLGAVARRQSTSFLGLAAWVRFRVAAPLFSDFKNLKLDFFNWHLFWVCFCFLVPPPPPQQLATGKQQTTTSNQQPATSNEQPTTSN